MGRDGGYCIGGGNGGGVVVVVVVAVEVLERWR